MEQVIIYLLMVQKLLNLKQKIVSTSLCLENISKDFSVDNIKRRNYMDMSMILVLIMMLLQLMIY